MYLQSISLFNFKNHIDTTLTFNEKVNCIVGKNGSGKTNLLDAIHYLCFCKSYFYRQDSFSVNFNSDFFAIHGDFMSDREVVNSIHCTFKNAHKSLKVNTKEYERFSDHIGKYPLIMVSPYDNEIINDGSEVRRRFFDIAISQFDKEYLNQLIVYQKIILNRNLLLKQMIASNTSDDSLISIYNEQLVSAGTLIFNKRKNYIEEILPALQYYYQLLSSDAEKVDILYSTQLAKNTFEDGLREFRSLDMKFGYSNFGIHRDDFIFNIDENTIKKFGSQGQQKTFSLALKLAQFDYVKLKINEFPILLLDDIFDKLDHLRIDQLLNLVSQDHFKQVFITETNEKLLKDFLSSHNIKGDIINIEDCFKKAPDNE